MEQLAPGQGEQPGDPGADPLAAADVTSLCLPLVSSEGGYGLTFQKPQKGAGDCSWKTDFEMVISSSCYPQHFGDDGRDAPELQRGTRPSGRHTIP